MSDYNYIKIAVHGQFDGEIKTVYTYPTEGVNGDWERSLFDPTAVIKNFLNARECYVLWNNAEGHYFSLISRNPLDSHTGYVLLSMMVADGYSLTGRQVINVLGALKKTLLEDGDRFDDAVTRCLEAVGVPRQGVKLESWNHPVIAPSQKSSGMCYRTYVSGQELESILSFPEQADYNRFDRVIVIPATASLRPGIHIERITSPVRKTYTVITPEGVVASKSVVSDGDRLVLTYEKPGFLARKETVIAGAPSPYVRYEGSALRVKSPKESGMGFVRRVKLVVKSAKGGIVTGYTINVNGRPVNTMEPYIELNEHELTPGSVTEISVASNNYRPLKVVKDSKALAEMDTLELELVPMEQGIILRLDFGEGRVFEQEISIEKNTPEYSQLHSGNFHGFRAHRMATPGAGEVYNVDVRSSSKPSAPVFTNVTEKAATTERRTKAPVFENLTKGGSAAPNDSEKKEADEKPTRGGLNIPAIASSKLGVILGAVLALIILICAFVFILPTGNKTEEEPTQEATTFTADPEELAKEEQQNRTATDQTATNQQQQQPAQAPAASPAADASEKEDIEYLNANRVWERSKLKSPKYQALYDAMRNGDIDAVVSNEYFTVSGNASNVYAEKVADYLWKAKGSIQNNRNVQKLKELTGENRVNIFDLYEALARLQPAASEANKAPRPGSN